MVRDPLETRAPLLQDVLDALDDEDCRAIVRALDRPMTASEIAEATDIPLSTTYRKLELLSEASLLDEEIEIRRDGRHTTRYAVSFEEVRIALSAEREFDVAIRHRTRTPEERLTEIWEEVRRET